MVVTLSDEQRAKIRFGVMNHADRIRPLAIELFGRVWLSTNPNAEFGASLDGPNSNYIKVDDTVWFLSGRPEENIILVRPHTRPRRVIGESDTYYCSHILRNRKDVNKFCDELGI